MSWLVLVEEAAAVHRLTKLATDDTITAGPRDRVVEWAYDRARRRGYVREEFDAGRFDPAVPNAWSQLAQDDAAAPKLAVLVTCRWCASVWVAAGVAVVRRCSWWPAMRRLLALSSASTLLARLEDG